MYDMRAKNQEVDAKAQKRCIILRIDLKAQARYLLIKSEMTQCYFDTCRHTRSREIPNQFYSFENVLRTLTPRSNIRYVVWETQYTFSIVVSRLFFSNLCFLKVPLNQSARNLLLSTATKKWLNGKESKPQPTAWQRNAVATQPWWQIIQETLGRTKF